MPYGILQVRLLLTIYYMPRVALTSSSIVCTCQIEPNSCISSLSFLRGYTLRSILQNQVAGIVVFLYDFALTFADEWSLIWSPLLYRLRRSSSSRGWWSAALTKGLPRPTILFLISRYSMSVIGILYLSGEYGSF